MPSILAAASLLVAFGTIAQSPSEATSAEAAASAALGETAGGAASAASATLDPAAEENRSNSLLAPPPAGMKVASILAGGGGYQFKTDLSNGGSLALTRLAAGTQVRVAFTDQFSLGLNFGFRYDDYDWGGDVFPAVTPPSGGSLAPWGSIYTVGIGAIMNWQLDERWTLSAGPLFQFSGESDVDAGDAFSGGGIVGAAYRFDDDLLVGGGVGVLTRIEDDPLVFPQIVLDWRINDRFRLTTQGGPTAVVRQGIELVYTPAKPLEFALGGRAEYLRFRLGGQDVAPDGIGEEQSYPLWLRAGWRPLPQLRVDVYAGVTIWSEFKLSDSSGGVLGKDTLDPAPFVAAYVSWTF
ncbi:MAG: DUF6268 family outer membrane beta-barrel protein [Phycisphaerales bacterium]